MINKEFEKLYTVEKIVLKHFTEYDTESFGWCTEVGLYQMVQTDFHLAYTFCEAHKEFLFEAIRESGNPHDNIRDLMIKAQILYYQNDITECLFDACIINAIDGIEKLSPDDISHIINRTKNKIENINEINYRKLKGLVNE